MSRRKLHGAERVAALAAALLLAGAGAAGAQAFGRILITVQDEQGEPIQGVRVTVVCEEMPQFREEITTDRKGRASLAVVDATHPYQLTFEHADYLPFEAEVKPEIRATTRREVTLLARSAPSPPTASAEGIPVSSPSLTPAQETFNQGVQAIKDGDLATAKEKFQAALELDRKLAAAHSGLAGVYLEEGDYAATLAEADRLLELEPGNARGFRLRYEAYKGLGQEEEAKQALKDLSQLQEGGDAAAIVYNEGVAALRVGDRDAAKARFEEALELQPGLGAALSALAIVYLNEGDYPRAAELAERLLALDPDSLQARRVRFDAYRLMGDSEKEEEAFQALAAADPQGAAELLYEAGAKLFDGGQMEQAAGLLARARQLDPDDPDILYRLGLAYVNLSQPDQAKDALGKFLEVAPEHPEAQVARDMLAYLDQQ